MEQELYRFVQVENPVLAESSAHLLRAGGKRLRPAFALLAGKTHFNYNLSSLMPLAVALEMIHMATLVHDDVIDVSTTRRGIPTVRAKWGDRVSLHTGYYLFAKSLILISGYDNRRISEILAEVSVQMCQGEIQQIATAFDVSQNTKDYFYRIRRKTALLIAASCQLGAIVVGAPPAWERALTSYGYNLGMAFQITDDILDLIADAAELGKPIGGDLRQGIITLPIIYAMKNSSRAQELQTMVAMRPKSDADIANAIDIIKESGAIDYAARVAEAYVNKAKKALSGLPANPARHSMQLIAEFIKVRNH